MGVSRFRRLIIDAQRKPYVRSARPRAGAASRPALCVDGKNRPGWALGTARVATAWRGVGIMHVSVMPVFASLSELVLTSLREIGAMIA